MARMTLTIDEHLLGEVGEALGTSSKAETIRVALTETLRQKRRTAALAHRGSLALDLDQETLTRLRAEP